MTATAPALGLSLLGGDPDHTALIADGTRLDYAELRDRVMRRRDELGDVRRLVMIAAGNAIEPIVTYLAALEGGHPVLLVSGGDDEAARAHRASLIARFDPDVVAHDGVSGWTLDERRAGSRHEFHPDLAVLSSTSGSTGSPKLVRLSAENVRSNAAAIAEYLQLTPADRAATTLPLQYCYGLSVVNSHLLTGASLLLTERSVADEEFWRRARTHAVTSFAGVPYTFELLEARGFDGGDLPSLRYLTQAGGRMAPDAVRRFAHLGRERGFELFVMYGQTEATARMAYLPPDLAMTHAGAIGRPVPGGAFRIDAVDGAESGELVYEGPNVMMGYAHGPEDFRLGRTVTELRTGDVARLRTDGLYEIVGRMNRFVKVFGLRLDLDRVEHLLADEGIEVRAASADERLLLFATSQRAADRARERAAALTGVPARVIGAHAVTEFPRTSNGKRDYAALVRFAAAHERSPAALRPTDPALVTAETVRDLYATLLGEPDAGIDDTFAGLGGDSLSYVELSLRLEEMVGALPRDWPTRTPRELAASASPPQQPVTNTESDAAPAGAAATSVMRPWRRRFSWTRLETPVVLRAAAIFVIVATHADLFALKGGAHLLLAVAGYNLARFQLAPAPGTARLRRLGRSATQLAVPAVLWIGAVALVTGQYAPTTVALLNNFVPGDGRWNEQWQFWFLEAMLWSFAGAAALFAVRRIERLERRAPFGFALVALAVALTARFAITGPTAEYVERYSAPVVLWLVVLGWLVARADTTARRIVVSVVAVAATFGFFGEPWREAIVAGGILALVWVRAIPLPRLAVPLVVTVAGASLFVYLTHWQVYPPFEQSAPWLGTLLSFVVGVIAYRLYVSAGAGAAVGWAWLRRATAPVSLRLRRA
ncbi:acyl-coenzyme A synthetase/AMP-(fatty) acid ligase [Microbacterium trichothecenolyticum]|uniref:AMP-binding protein n=1 Tax=Microbacterium trichothecenolyticum TaxID=69370 RepID=UPI002859034B|nr:AMP-binding protein [Microbacterium trichothecenolyticum]MDR7111568.1 acyl-coenzyme A synthetase/AMP-(fatty) acid ligase [Microbacterium trichothecenolyticum]